MKKQLGVARKCADGLFRCRLNGSDLAKCQKLGDRCALRLAKLADPERGLAAKLETAIVKACGDLPANAILSDAGLGFESVTGSAQKERCVSA